MKSLAMLFLPLFFLIQAKRTFAQEEREIVPHVEPSQKKYIVGVTLGMGNLVTRDRVISNYLYSGNYVPLGFHFEIEKEHRTLKFGAQFLNGPTLKTTTNEGFEYKGELGEFYPNEKEGLDFSTVRSKMFSLRMTQLYTLGKSELRTIQISLGYDLKYSLFKKKFLQFEYVNDLNDRLISAGFALHFKWRIHPKHSLQYDITLPIISHVKRTLYNSEAKPETVSEQKFTIIKSAFGFDSQLSYRFQVSDRFSLRAAYAFSYLQLSFPRKEQWAYNQFTLGAYFHI